MITLPFVQTVKELSNYLCLNKEAKGRNRKGFQIPPLQNTEVLSRSHGKRQPSLFHNETVHTFQRRACHKW